MTDAPHGGGSGRGRVGEKVEGREGVGFMQMLIEYSTCRHEEEDSDLAVGCEIPPLAACTRSRNLLCSLVPALMA